MSFFKAMEFSGKYGSLPNDCRFEMYVPQLVQAVFFVGVPARVVTISFMILILCIPHNPLAWIASIYYNWNVPCFTKEIVILYMMPLCGDTTQFILVDTIQKLRPLDTSLSVPCPTYMPPPIL